MERALGERFAKTFWVKVGDGAIGNWIFNIEQAYFIR